MVRPESRSFLPFTLRHVSQSQDFFLGFLLRRIIFLAIQRSRRGAVVCVLTPPREVRRELEERTRDTGGRSHGSHVVAEEEVLREERGKGEAHTIQYLHRMDRRHRRRRSKTEKEPRVPEREREKKDESERVVSCRRTPSEFHAREGKTHSLENAPATLKTERTRR